MQSWFNRNWKLAGAVVLLTSVAALSLGRPPRDGSPTATTTDEALTNTEPIGGEAMFSRTRTQNAVSHANETNFERLVLDSETPVLVDFYADWCQPCRMLAPMLEELARETPNARIVKVNVDDSPSLAAQYRISSIPNLKLFKDGQVVAEQVGVPSKGYLQSLLQ